MNNQPSILALFWAIITRTLVISINEATTHTGGTWIESEFLFHIIRLIVEGFFVICARGWASIYVCYVVIAGDCAVASVVLVPQLSIRAFSFRTLQLFINKILKDLVVLIGEIAISKLTA